MKKIIMLFLMAALSFAFTAQHADKYYTVRFTPASLGFHFQNLNAIEQVLNESNLPHQQVIFMLNSIDSLKREIFLQLPDSVRNKK